MAPGRAVARAAAVALEAEGELALARRLRVAQLGASEEHAPLQVTRGHVLRARIVPARVARRVRARDQRIRLFCARQEAEVCVERAALET